MTLHYGKPEMVSRHDADVLPVDLGKPVEIADRIWWVGSMERSEMFQCLPYLIESGSDSVLIDPGSALSIDETLERVAQIVPVEHIRWVVCHHSDPDIAGGLVRLRDVVTRGDAMLVTEWRAETLLRHYGHDFPVQLIEEHDWMLPLSDDRQLQFVLTPYLHFPGALCSYETSTRVLFSSDLFGGFTDGSSLVATDSSHFESIRSFHEHYMPSREILVAGLGRIRRAFPEIALVAPQHGCVIPEHLVDEMFDRMAELECGIFLLAREDLDVARLLRVASALRRITGALVMAHDFPELVATIERILPELVPVAGISVYAEIHDEGWVEFSGGDHWQGVPAAALPEHVEPSLEFPLPGDGPRSIAVVRLSEPADVTTEVAEMFKQLGPALRIALDRHIVARAERREQEESYQRARHDPLTGLYNRRKLEGIDATGRQLAALMLDIDHFKRVNDEFGHDAGDEVLRRVAAAIANGIRSQDIAIRHGGEEFLVLLDDADEMLAEQIAERIRLDIRTIDAQHLAPQGHVTASIGVALHDGGPSLDPAIAACDAAMYDAKLSGRDQVRVAAGLTPIA
jgi:two-component system cell cycle response regulator